MLNKFGLLGAALALCLLPAEAQALTSYTFEGTTPDTLIDVRFTADLTISGDTLTIVLTNDSLNHSNGPSPTLNPNDLLTSFYFDIFNGTNRPTLTWVSATGDVYQGVNPGADTLTQAAADLMAGTHQSWDFKQGLTLSPGSETLTFGIGAGRGGEQQPEPQQLQRLHHRWARLPDLRRRCEHEQPDDRPGQGLGDLHVLGSELGSERGVHRGGPLHPGSLRSGHPARQHRLRA